MMKESCSRVKENKPWQRCITNSVDPALSLEICFVVPHPTQFNVVAHLAHLVAHQRAAVFRRECGELGVVSKNP